ncbi:uncharacterized protein LOC120154478 [Hibiscus syriacus]|uniref:uncharacterized protein LOC120154478 n=1 Tax=Hibiscus syriacus TaxID=106335 RepID=UPI001921C465|nr:uncharacterized protein LOC120154478 [Hibiscus syriacus]
MVLLIMGWYFFCGWSHSSLWHLLMLTGGSIDDRQSIFGTCVFLGGSLVKWNSKKNKTMSRSTTEAEYRSLADTTSDVIWLEALLNDMKVQVRATSVVLKMNDYQVAEAETKSWLEMVLKSMSAWSMPLALSLWNLKKEYNLKLT